MAERTDVSSETDQAEKAEERAAHEPDRMPTDDEATIADRTTEKLRQSGEAEDVAAHHRDMDERGAHIKGEGQID